jgi:protein-tyrosine phosphatase
MYPMLCAPLQESGKEARISNDAALSIHLTRPGASFNTALDTLSDLNFRDLGGLPVAGGTIRRGIIYRSEGPASFSEVHRIELIKRNFRLVCDLRSASERTRKPNDWAGNARLLNIDIITDLRDLTNDGWRVLSAKPSAQGAREAMIGNYRAMPAAFQPHVAKLIDALIAGESPVLIHCTAGKDRTGVLIALLLRLMGASDEAILRDYLLSDRFRQGGSGADLVRRVFTRAFGYAPDEQTLVPIIGVDPAYLQAAFDSVAARWGAVEAYFAGAGIDEGKREALAARLVERDAGPV